MSATKDTSLGEIALLICKARRWEFVAPVGGGAFKEVFEVRDDSGRQLALKVVKANAAPDRTEREISAIERCDHPNIARILHVGRQDGSSRCFDYLVEEFLGGGTLAQRVASQGNLDDAAVLSLGETIIGAVEHIAQLGLVHRDIKPDNIMYRDEDDAPVLVDFGLVRDLRRGSLTQTWMNCGPGTPYFASPEQLNNEKYLIDWRTDQFCLGVALAYVRFGFHPYAQKHEVGLHGATVDAVAQRGPQSERFISSASEANLRALVKMTKQWPVERYTMPNDLVSAWKSQTEG